MRVSQMGVRAVRVKLQGTTVLTLRRAPVPVVPEDCEAEDGVSFGQGVVNLDGLLHRRFCIWEKFARGHVAVERERAGCVGESDVGERLTGVEMNRLPAI